MDLLQHIGDFDRPFLYGMDSAGKEAVVGSVALVDLMPRIVPEDCPTADFRVVQAARTSYGQGTKSASDDRGLIRYLMRLRHSTPFEMPRFVFRLRMPKFVYAQFFRHRTNEHGDLVIESSDEAMRKFVSMNEYSARYSIVPDMYYIPVEWRKQSSTNKQGSGGRFELPDDLRLTKVADDAVRVAYEAYKHLIGSGVARELARVVLPVASVTEFYVSVDLWNLLGFLKLRLAPDAQFEIRVLAEEMLKILKLACPVSVEAWEAYSRFAVNLSKMEIDAIRSFLDLDSWEGAGSSASTLMQEFEKFLVDNAGHLSKREAGELIAKLRGDNG